MGGTGCCSGPSTTGCGGSARASPRIRSAATGWPGSSPVADHGAVTDSDAPSFSLATPPLFAALAPARRVLIAGAGGGFDVYAGLPLALALWEKGVDVHLANLSFS